MTSAAERQAPARRSKLTLSILAVVMAVMLSVTLVFSKALPVLLLSLFFGVFGGGDAGFPLFAFAVLAASAAIFVFAILSWRRPTVFRVALLVVATAAVVASIWFNADMRDLFRLTTGLAVFEA